MTYIEVAAATKLLNLRSGRTKFSASKYFKVFFFFKKVGSYAAVKLHLQPRLHLGTVIGTVYLVSSPLYQSATVTPKGN